MSKKKINANIIADSKNEFGQRITTFVLTYPRFIHAELLTHRLFSRNAASSRAIPASKMIKDIEEDPFIPVAWQKAHKGMQGTEYMNKEEAGSAEILWLHGRNEAINTARALLMGDTTKQLVNRILEPYQWYTCIVTATEYDNFFELRCPQYQNPTDSADDPIYFKSRKDYCEFYNVEDNGTDLTWLKHNKGQGEIHISLLAEAMWDSLQESEPKQLKAGQWHIPFGDKITLDVNRWSFLGTPEELVGKDFTEHAIKIATARCARVSYLNFEGKDDYEADIKLYDRLFGPPLHASPFEHPGRSMNETEFFSSSKSYFIPDVSEVPAKLKEDVSKGITKVVAVKGGIKVVEYGWSGNFRGFVQLRKEIE